MNTPVIAGIDFSAGSPSVLRQAVHVAARSGVPVIAVSVIDTGRAAQWGDDSDAVQVLFSRARAKLEALVKELPAGADVRIDVRGGHAADELQKLVNEHQSSLLVIAANDLSKKRLGSVASRCVRTAHCDVLVLRDWQQGDFKKIVVCSDFSPTSARALKRGIEVAQTNKAALEIAHVMYPPTLDPWGEAMDHAMDSPTPYPDACRARIKRRMENFLAPHASSLESIVHEETVLESASAVVALTSHFRFVHADLVVLGTHELSRIAGFFIGTNAENLLNDATVSVLAVRD